MVDIKLTATFSVGSNKLYNEKEYKKWSEQHQKWKYDEKKVDRHVLNLKVKKFDNKYKKSFNITEPLYFSTPKAIPTRQVTNVSRIAYEYYISNEVPEGFTIGNNNHIRQLIQAWKRMSNDAKIEWHLNRVAHDMHGELLSYQILED